MKAILVIDAPNECDECPCLNYKLWYCQADPKHRDGAEDYVPEWCPLKPMPQNKEIIGTKYIKDSNQYALGWNACIDEILGEEE